MWVWHMQHMRASGHEVTHVHAAWSSVRARTVAVSIIETVDGRQHFDHRVCHTLFLRKPRANLTNSSIRKRVEEPNELVKRH